MSPAHTNILKQLTRHFGDAPTMLWEPNEEEPSVGCAYFPADKTGRPWGTLVSVGMSLNPMVMDDRAVDSDTARAEIVTYVKADETELDDIASLVCWAGMFPFLQEPQTFLGWGHTILSHDLFAHSSLTTLLTLTSIVKADNEPVFQMENEDVGLLWLTFLTDEEYEWKKKRGANALLDLFEKHKHPIALDRNRKSYVE